MKEARPLEALISNPDLTAALYETYLKSPKEVDPFWRDFFDSLEKETAVSEEMQLFIGSESCNVLRLIQNYRTYGHLACAVNPIALNPLKEPVELKIEAAGFRTQDLPKSFPTLGLLPEKEAPLEKIVHTLRQIYCGAIGYEYKGIVSHKEEAWIEERIEPLRGNTPLSEEVKSRILKQLNKSELLETFLHMKFPGQKRFSLEGSETLIPMLFELIEKSAEFGADEFVLGMAHRGRLNVLANILNKSYEEIFSEFDEGYFPDSFEGTGDVKYHKGFLSDAMTVAGHRITVTLTPNPSHLESVDPVIEGIVKGIQVKRNDTDFEKVIPILVHGDAALSGQGVVYETLQLNGLTAYSTGGTFHLVVNNQIGFTTSPEDSRSTRYCTDIAKAFGMPVFHVNGEDPEACVFACLLAAEYRKTFHRDIFIELNCYRKYGHNESDEPAFTQPLLYQLIRKKKSIREIYREKLVQEGQIEKQRAETLEEEFKKELASAQASALKKGQNSTYGTQEKEGKENAPETAISAERLHKIAQAFCLVPEGFKPHPKLAALFKERLSMALQQPQKKGLDWGMAEFLALGSIVSEGQPVRLSGQDSGRGTFTHRHALWVDQENGNAYYPLSHIDPEQGRADVINSSLSEYAALGFEYGYSLGYPETLVLWEAQFGDFANGAQVVIDQYIASGEQKWGQRSNLCLLLPHGYEGQGPEHSSARLERFLSLAGHDNLRIVYPSTPSQFFHLLRLQAQCKEKIPLVVMTPKALLRLPECVSPIEEFTKGRFEPVILDKGIETAECISFCTGKIYYDLKKEKVDACCLVRIEELYPFPEQELKEGIAKASHAKRWVFSQEEPENMGAWRYIRAKLEALLPNGAQLEYNGREASAAPAAGSYILHKKELKSILAFLNQSRNEAAS